MRPGNTFKAQANDEIEIEYIRLSFGGIWYGGVISSAAAGKSGYFQVARQLGWFPRLSVYWFVSAAWWKSGSATHRDLIFQGECSQRAPVSGDWIQDSWELGVYPTPINCHSPVGWSLPVPLYLYSAWRPKIGSQIYQMCTSCQSKGWRNNSWGQRLFLWLYSNGPSSHPSLWTELGHFEYCLSNDPPSCTNLHISWE